VSSPFVCDGWRGAAYIQEVNQMELDEKRKHRPKMVYIEDNGMRYVSTEAMERMTRVFPPTKAPHSFAAFFAF